MRSHIKQASICVMSFILIFSLLIIPVSADELEIPEEETEIDEYDAGPDYYFLSITPIMQTVNYYCAPVCILMTMKYFYPSTSLTAQSIANSIGTTPGSGSTTEKVCEFLQNNLSGNYAHMTYSNTMRFNRLRNSIMSGYPVIVSVMVMPGHTFYDGHFILVKGFMYGTTESGNVSNIYYNDPYDGLQKTITFSTLDYGCTSNQGNYTYYN